MAHCTKCGGPLIEGQVFCGNCGQSLGAGPAAAAPAPPTPPAPSAPPAFPPQPQYQAPPAPYGQPAYGPGPGYPPGAWQPPRKSKKGLWIGLAAAVVVIAVAAILVFVVFWGQISGGGGPEKTVQRLLSSLEDKNAEAFISVLAPGAIDVLAGGFISAEEAPALIEENVFTYESMKFDGLKMQTETSGNEATVTITAGSVTTTENGETTTEDIVESDTPTEVYLVRQDGKWYIDPSTFD